MKLLLPIAQHANYEKWFQIQDKMTKYPKNVINFFKNNLKEKIQPQLLEKQAHINDNIVRKYFPMTLCLENPIVWAPDVCHFKVYDKSSKFIGTLYLDSYPCQDKYNHLDNYSLDYGYTNMDGYCNYPIAAMIKNFFLTNQENSIFINSKGKHVLHQVYSNKWSRFNDINAEKDFVECPAQMLEYFVWKPEEDPNMNISNNCTVFNYIMNRYDNGLRYRRAVLRKDSIESSMTLIRGFLFIKTGGFLSEISIIEETKNIIGNYKENYSILYIKIYEQDFQKCIINVEGNVTGL
ncbi:peptidase family M3-domain-containing protein [Neocallimastix lanati (nom. inval.)]|nr:peptidase family M3-domain-containing protein [Neocallimastix sp. JGI-2020a]